MAGEPHNTACVQRPRARGQSGASLIFVLALIGLFAVTSVALAAYASSNARATQAYDDVRADRYAGDGAIKTAINWIKDTPGVAIDPLYAPASAEECVVHVNDVTVTCQAEAGSGSGVPPEQGALPPESLLLLGSRHNEPGPYSYSQCDSVFDSVSRFFTRETQGESEYSLTMRKAPRSSGWASLGSCQPRTRGNGPVSVKGDVAAAGKIRTATGLNIAAYQGDGTIRAKYGCETENNPQGTTCAPWPADGLRDDPGAPWDDTPLDSDPGRSTPIGPTPIDNIRPEFLPIGFDADGTLRDGYSLPERTTAYYVDRTTNTSGSATVPKYLRPAATCADVPAGSPIIFLPGWYRSSEVLSKYTANASTNCFDRTFWFPPDAGADLELLTSDDVTAAYYMDFTALSGRGCGTIAAPATMTAEAAARWCIGGAAQNASQATLNSKPRVVVGWPSVWQPFPAGGATLPGTPVYGTPVPVKLTTAGKVAGSFLTYWTDQGSARSIDGAPAVYAPCRFWIFTCPTLGERTLRLEDFTPKAIGGPLAETGATAGRIYVKVAYGLEHRESLGTPWLDVDVLDQEGVAVSCGSYEMPNSAAHDYAGSGPIPSYTFTADQAKQLADACGAVDRINSLRFSLRIGGNVLNNPLSKVYLDGVEVSYNSYSGASFPVGTDNSYGSTLPAKSDCDETKPGGQLIFGGQSHVYVADGSLEVCGGPDPDNPSGAQVIGIYGVPAVDPLRPNSDPSVDSASSGSGSTSVNDRSNMREIGEATGLRASKVSYRGRCWGLGLGTCGPEDGGAKDIVFTFPSFTPPAGYSLASVSARASYSTEGEWYTIATNSDSARLKVGSCNVAARQTKGSMRYWANEGEQGGSPLVVFSPTRNCTSQSNAAGAALPSTTVRWKANVPSEFVPFVGRCVIIITCTYTQEDYLDGIELDVTLKPSDPNVPMLRPQSGCITAHPNYTGGEATPDCAVVRADSFVSSDQRESATATRGTWAGRVSVKGTIYAPSAAVEIDDSDIAYPLATRGAILRHLRISGATTRSGYTDPMIGGDIDRTPAPRVATLTACRRSAADLADPATADLPCGENDDDRMLTQAGVRFMTPEQQGETVSAANAPKVEWWADRRTGGSA
jgi:hypothetical protein